MILNIFLNCFLLLISLKLTTHIQLNLNDRKQLSLQFINSSTMISSSIFLISGLKIIYSLKNIVLII